MVTVKVRAIIDGVRDNGKTYNKGDEFMMAQALVKSHVAAGQVEDVEDIEDKKAQNTPADKSVKTTPKTK